MEENKCSEGLSLCLEIPLVPEVVVHLVQNFAFVLERFSGVKIAVDDVEFETGQESDPYPQPMHKL